MSDVNPFLRGPCFATGTHHVCKGREDTWPAPVRPGDRPETIRWRYHVWRCPCPCGHPWQSALASAPPTA